MFWKSVAPFFSNKSKKSNNIMLTEGRKVINDNDKCTNTFNRCFSDNAKELKIPRNEHVFQNIISIDESWAEILAATEKYKRHSSILKIKQRTNSQVIKHLDRELNKLCKFF